MKRTRQPSAGFTLLEVLLALGLSVIVLSGANYLFDMYRRSVQRVRQQTEDDQLARALLRRFSEDVRGTLRYQQPNTSNLTSSLLSGGSGSSSSTSSSSSGGSSSNSTGSSSTNSTNSNASAGGTASGTSGGSSANKSATGSSSSSGSSSSNSASSSGTSTGSGTSNNASSGGTTTSVDLDPPPGVYGSVDQMQLDLTRFPRTDEALLGMGSEIMSVSYRADGSGLIRRQEKRTERLLGTGSPAAEIVIAPEVVAVEFQYFDGGAWQTSWDSSVQQGVPLAIRVGFALRRSEAAKDPMDERLTGSLLSGGCNWPSDLIYRQTIRLPTGELPSAAASGTSTETDSSNSNSSSNTSSSTSNTTGSSSGSTSTSGSTTSGRGSTAVPSAPTVGGSSGTGTTGQGSSGTLNNGGRTR